MQYKPTTPPSTTNGISDGAMLSANPTADSTASRASLEFRNFVGDVEDLITETTSLTGADLTRAKAKLSARVTAAKESIQEMSDVVVQRARKTATDTNVYVHNKPWQAVGIGAAVGVLLGFALGRRR
ncbi:MAG: DUF883 domain-containing protein [Candidatus Obscuribacterales bacterium]|nr:DUF883 domain-containing protein [Steroidobacteraceae bacterium]